METVTSIGLGIGLSAACGFRVFVPLLIASILGMAGWLPMTSEGTQWLATVPAVVTFATATLLEVLAYLIPWLDNLLDSIATPAAVVAGVLVSVSTMVGLPPLVRWTVAIIAGGGVAGAVQGMTVLARAKSSTFTGGAGNHVIAIGEVLGSIVASVAAIFFPIIALVLVLIGLYVIYRISRRIRLRRDKIGHAGQRPQIQHR